MTNKSLKDQLEDWKKVQHAVASQVIVHEDSDDDSKQSGKFKRLPRAVSNGSNYYGGVDVSFPEKESGDQRAVATYVIVNSQGTVVYQDHEYFHLSVPYVSSFLSFREIDPLQRLVETQLREHPDVTPCVILVDGNGILHVRRAGIASFLGVRTGIATIGVGKKLYCVDGLQKDLVSAGLDEMLVRLKSEVETFGNTASSPVVLFDRVSVCPTSHQSYSKPITHQAIDKGPALQAAAQHCKGIGVRLQGASGNILGAALLGHGGEIGGNQRIKSGTKNPIYISVGHNIGLEKAVSICAELSRARIPEPVRQADLWGRKLLRQKKGKTRK